MVLSNDTAKPYKDVSCKDAFISQSVEVDERLCKQTIIKP